MKFNLTHTELKGMEYSVFSQLGQDGVLEAIFNQLEIDKGYFIEFGGRDGVEISNSANLRLNHGWTGLLMDAEPLSVIVHKEFITSENINYLIKKYSAYNEVDLLCVDLDGIDWFVFKEIEILPKVICIEYNSKFKNTESFTIEYNPNHKWEGDDYYGASLLALKKLGEQKGYTLVHIVEQLDAIFVRNDLLDESYVPPKIWELLPSPIIAHEVVSNKKWIEV